MRVDDPAPERLAAYFTALKARAAASGPPEWVKYIALGPLTLRLVNYDPEFTPHVEKQLTYVLRDQAPQYEATLVIWREKGLDGLSGFLEQRVDPQKYLRLRVEKLVPGRKPPRRPAAGLQVFSRAYSRPLLEVNTRTRLVQAHDPVTATWYYAAENLEPEEFIKRGHIFVQVFNQMLKGPSTALVHAALIGLEGQGALLCARGQRGKSTLALRALMDGFDYVADDYLVLGRESAGLHAWPIYSIVTLSPMMYGELYQTLKAKFVSNNARKDKYVFNIEAYHPWFRSRYPVRFGLFPQIVSDSSPGVTAVTRAGRGRAVVQLIHSTISQMGDKHDIGTIKKLLGFVSDLPFYQINLCRDIEKNLRCLREFLLGGACTPAATGPESLSSCSVPPRFFGWQ